MLGGVLDWKGGLADFIIIILLLDGCNLTELKTMLQLLW